MEWQKLQSGIAKRFVLDDGAKVIGVISVSDGKAQVAFFGDGGGIESAETQSERLGGFSDFIDSLQPQDVIDICRMMDKAADGS